MQVLFIIVVAGASGGFASYDFATGNPLQGAIGVGLCIATALFAMKA